MDLTEGQKYGTPKDKCFFWLSPNLNMIFFSSKLATSIANNQRRKYNIPKGKRHPKHPIVFKKAEDIAGYEKFTLDEVIYPEDKFDDKKVEKVEVKMTFFLFP